MELHQVKFEKLVFGGDCLGRLTDGRAVFVPFVLPGEIAEIEITNSKERFAHGRLHTLLQTSPLRVQAPCPYFGVCGGCHYQNLSYANQLAIKQELIRDQLTRIGKLTDLPAFEVAPSPLPFGYRNQVQFHPVPAQGPQAPLSLGFKRAESAEVIPIARCLLIPDEMNELLSQIELENDVDLSRLAIRCDSQSELMLVFEGESEAAPDLTLELPVSSTYLSPDGRSLNMGGNDYLIYTLLGQNFLVSPESFFQVNLPVAEMLIRHIQQLIDQRQNLNILELYSGVGLFTRFLAPHAIQLTAIESSPSACFDFADNLSAFENISLYEGPVEEILPGLVEQIKPVDLVVLDPPRAGVNPKARQALMDLQPPEILYISCDPSTLARDLHRLTEDGYTLQSLHAFDMFPQTAHVETMTVLRRTQRVTS